MFHFLSCFLPFSRMRTKNNDMSDRKRKRRAYERIKSKRNQWEWAKESDITISCRMRHEAILSYWTLAAFKTNAYYS